MPDKRRIKAFHVALRDAKLTSQKYNILNGYGVSSTTELTNEQADELIAMLEKEYQSLKTDPPLDIRKARSTILTLLNKLGIYATNGDWKQVNEYLLQPRIAGKLLYQMSVDEMTALNRKLRKMVRDRQQKEGDIKYQETNN